MRHHHRLDRPPVSEQLPPHRPPGRHQRGVGLLHARPASPASPASAATSAAENRSLGHLPSRADVSRSSSQGVYQSSHDSTNPTKIAPVS